jgi:hypothetical protein
MREQAFIVYDNVASASTAKRGLNGFTFFDRPIVSRLEGKNWGMKKKVLTKL